MRYRVLGPLEVEGPDGPGPRPGGRKQRILLAGLLSRAPRPAATGVLIDALWTRDLPADPGSALHTQVSRLRAFLRGLDPTAGVAREAEGYRLGGDVELDAERFEAAVAGARDAPTPESCLALLSEALSLVRGRPYEGLEDVPLLDGEARRLEALIGTARERSVECLLALGRVSEAREAAAPLVDADPLREKPRALLMEALYRDGRAPEALDTFQEYRRLLSGELGLEPSPGIRQLELEILRHGRALQGGHGPGHAPDGAASAPGPPAPDLQIGFVDRPAGRLAYAEAGHGPPLLVLPGWVNSLSGLAAGGDPRSAFFERLSRRFRLVLFDRVGMGLSTGPLDRYSPDRDVDEALAVLDALGIRRAHLLAMSQAGPPAILLAERHPDRVSRLVLMGTYASGPRVFHREDLRRSMLGLVRASWGLGSELLAHLIVPDASADQLRAFARLQRESASPERAALVLEGFYAADVTDRLPHLRLPTLVLHYDGDRAVPARGGRELASLIPGARLVLLSGTAHLPAEADMDLLVDMVQTFLESGAAAPLLDDPPRPPAR